MERLSCFSVGCITRPGWQPTESSKSECQARHLEWERWSSQVGTRTNWCQRIQRVHHRHRQRCDYFWIGAKPFFDWQTFSTPLSILQFHIRKENSKVAKASFPVRYQGWTGKIAELEKFISPEIYPRRYKTPMIVWPIQTMSEKKRSSPFPV